MKKQKLIITVFICLFFFNSFSQNVGIGTVTPNANALLHVDLGASTSKGLLFTGTNNAASTIPNLGAGSRLMYYPGKSAFRVGNVSGTQWDNVNAGLFSIATGNNTVASGQASTALGSTTTASGDNSTSMGSSTIASLFASTAMGSGTIAGAQMSTAMGSGTFAAGQVSTAMGYLSQARGFYSTSMGEFTLAKGYASTVVGMFNDPVILTDENSVSATTPLFIIGNGVNNTTRSNAMVVRKDGNTGIGVSNPSFRLDIADRIRLRSGGTNATSPGLWLNNINNSGQLGFMGVYDDTYMGWYGNGGASWTLMMNVANGNIGIGNQNPTFKLDISDRMRIRSGSGANTAGLYFNKADNSNVQAFMGMKDDNYVGLFGVPLNNWGLLMNTANGNIGINNASPQALLHVVRGLKTNGPLHPTAAAIFEGDQDSWIQLSNNNNREGGILSGNQQTAIRSGIIFGTDSSLQLRSGGNFTRLTIDKTGDASFSGDASISGNASISGTANITGNATISGQANVIGNAVITGEVRRPATGSANLVPICMGSVNLVGTILGGTGNFSVDWISDGYYIITISGESYNTSNYITHITPITSSTRFVRVVENNQQIHVRINGEGITGSVATSFHFTVYKL